MRWYSGHLTSTDPRSTLIDTAESYHNESQVGKALRGRSSEAFIATKVSASNFRYADVLKPLSARMVSCPSADQSLQNFRYP